MDLSWGNPFSALHSQRAGKQHISSCSELSHIPTCLPCSQGIVCPHTWRQHRHESDFPGRIVPGVSFTWNYGSEFSISILLIISARWKHLQGSKPSTGTSSFGAVSVLHPGPFSTHTPDKKSLKNSQLQSQSGFCHPDMALMPCRGHDLAQKRF